MAEIPNRRLRHAVAKERNVGLEAEPKGDGRWAIAACILQRHLTGFRVPRSEFTRGLLGTASSNPREDECVKRTALCFSTVVFQGRQHIWMLLDFTASPRALAFRIELNTQLWRLPGPCYRWQKFQKRKTPWTLRACPKSFVSTEGSECGTHEGPSRGGGEEPFHHVTLQPPWTRRTIEAHLQPPPLQGSSTCCSLNNLRLLSHLDAAQPSQQR